MACRSVRLPAVPTSSSEVEPAPERKLRQVDREHRRGGRDRNEEQRIGPQRQQHACCHEAGDRDRRDPAMDVVRVLRPDAEELLNRVRGDADPRDGNRFEDVGGLRQVAAAQDLARDEVAGEVHDGDCKDAPGAEPVPVEGEERRRCRHDEQEAEVDGDDGPEAEQARGRRSLRLQLGELVPEVVDLVWIVTVRGEPALELARRQVEVRRAAVACR